MEEHKSDIVSEPLNISTNESIYRNGLFSQISMLNRNDKVALISYLIQDINIDIPFRTDEAGRIILTQEMRDALTKAEICLDNSECLTEEDFNLRFSKWL